MLISRYRLVDWFRTREETRWDQQVDRDSIAGKLDFLFKEADSELAVPRPIGESGFVGMWAYRDDITDGVSYINRLRDKPRR